MRGIQVKRLAARRKRAAINFLKTLWVHHAIHHYKDDTRAYGVSSPLWDWILGTMPDRSK